jgi:hypothetical protein
MPSPNNITNITPPRVPLIDERSGFVSREWYRFFLNLFTLTGSGTNVTSLTDLQLGPTQESALDQIAELAKQVEALSVLPLTTWVLSELAELQSQIDGLSATSVSPISFLTNGSSILYGDNLGGFSNVVIGSGVSFSGGTLSATGSGGTVTAVTGTAPVVSSGGTTPAISMPKATSSVDGYLSSTDWTTFNNKQPAGTYVTSVGATAPITTTGGTTPTIGVTAAALTKVDDTNVTLTLGGTPATSLLAATSLTLGWSGELAATRGGTGFGSYAVGDILYANTTTTLAKLADVATGNALISGGVGVAPSWGKIGLTTHVSGTLPVGNGGTGTATAFTAGSVVFAGASGVYSQDNSNFFWDAANIRLGIDTATPACALDVVGGIQTSRTGVTTPAATDGNIFSGTYTPIQVSTNTNVDAVTYQSAQYMRVGNTVTISGRVDIDATATGNTVVQFSLPIASNFSSTAQGAGTAAFTSATVANNSFARLSAQTTDDCIFLQCNSTITTSASWFYTFTYRVI